jgi:anti-anti-sigma factor
MGATYGRNATVEPLRSKNVVKQEMQKNAGDRIVDIAKGAHKRVLLNLEKLEYVSSAGLRVILRGAKLLRVNRGELKICNASGLVRNVLETSGFNGRSARIHFFRCNW